MGINGTVIVGVQRDGNNTNYRIVMYNYEPEKNSWEFNKTIVEESKLLIAAIEKKIRLRNVSVVAGKLNWDTGAISRFLNSSKNGVNPFVIISELRVKHNNKLIGYKIATFDGKIRNIKYGDLINYCSNIYNRAKGNSIEVVPIQNAVFIPQTDNSPASIRGYKEDQFIHETIEVNRPSNVNQAKVDMKENNKIVSRPKLDDIFTEDQINELRLGKRNNVDIRMYGNPKMSAKQMKEIRLALQDNINPKVFADPAFKADCMKAYRLNLKYGVDVSQFINPEYNVDQIYELSTAVISGVNLAKLADPKKSAHDMAKERIELEASLWKEIEVKDNSIN